jgi:hypothetical protein
MNPDPAGGFSALTLCSIARCGAMERNEWKAI